MDGADLRTGDAASVVEIRRAGPIRLGLLSNAGSGTGRRRNHLTVAAREAGVNHVVTQHAHELESALAALAAEGTNVLAIDGGDGTVQATLSALRRSRIMPREPIIALLHGGTTNMIHRDVGVAGPPDRALRRLVAACREGLPRRIVARRPIMICGGNDPSSREYGFFFGAGAIPRAIRLVRARLHPWGLTGPVGEALSLSWLLRRLLSRRIWGDPVLRPERIAQAVGNADWSQRELVFLLASTLERLILGLRPVESGEGFGVVALDWPYERLWQALPSLATGRRLPTTVNGLTVTQAQEIVMRPGTAYILDGELAQASSATPLTVTTAPPAYFLRL